MALRSLWQLITSDLGVVKNRLRHAPSGREKAFIWLALLLKSALTLAFCLAFVLSLVFFFGTDTATVGVVVLLSVLTFQKAHFGYHALQGAASVLVIYAGLIVGPALAVRLTPLPAALVNAAILLVILVLGCAQIEFQNHIVLVLSYLLLYGYPVWGPRLALRAALLAAGGIWAASIIYRHHRQRTDLKPLGQVLRAFNLRNAGDEWKLKLAVLVPLSMLMGQYLGLEREMWIGIAAMSVMSPYHHLRWKRGLERAGGTLVGALLFYLLTLIPHLSAPALGIAGGFLVGLTTSYRYQTIFNSLGALSIAMLLYGPTHSLWLRIADNFFAIAFVLACVFILDSCVNYLRGRGKKRP